LRIKRYPRLDDEESRAYITTDGRIVRRYHRIINSLGVRWEVKSVGDGYLRADTRDGIIRLLERDTKLSSGNTTRMRIRRF